MVSLLDAVIHFFIDSTNLNMTRSYGRRLYGRIEFLDNQKLLFNAANLHETRKRRNDLAHEVKNRVTWEELDVTLDMVEAELQHLNIVSGKPKYEFCAERSRVLDSPKEEVAFVHDCCYGLKENGEMVIEVSWSVEIHRTTSP